MNLMNLRSKHDREKYFCFLLEFTPSIGKDDQLLTSLYDERDDFNAHITNFPFLSNDVAS